MDLRKFKTAADIWAKLRAGTKERVEQIMLQALELKGENPNIESVDLIAKALGYTVDINDQGETIYYYEQEKQK